MVVRSGGMAANRQEKVLLDKAHGRTRIGAQPHKRVGTGLKAGTASPRAADAGERDGEGLMGRGPRLE
jgi:hypothetical protein